MARSNLVRASVLPSRQQLAFQGIRCYAASSGLSKDEVQGRILDLLKNFDKVWHLMRLGLDMADMNY